MTRPAWTLTLAVGLGLALSACASDRLRSPRPVASAARAPVASGPVYNEPPQIEPVAPAPSGAVTSEPLPPPPGTPGPVASLDPPPVQAPPAPPPVPAAPPPAQAAGPSRSSYVGGWTAREASGSCRLQLSSTPSLDLYKASATGCGNKDLARVTAWDYRDGEVYLYQPGGSVAARLKPAGAAMQGVLAKSGAPLDLAR